MSQLRITQPNQINELVEHMNFKDLYHTGRYPYHPALLLKLILFAYARGFRSGRQIVRFADENKVAMWLTQGEVPSYRTINRFRVNYKIDDMITDMFNQLGDRLLKLGLIDDVIFIDGTKVLADANKYLFVWRKSTIRYSELNQTKAKELIHEIQQTQDNLPSLKQENLSLDEIPEQTVLIPYGTMLRENSHKWQSDDRKVMNWEYDEYRDEYTDKNGILFTFHNYSKRTDKSGITRDFKVHQAESKDENNQTIPEALTPKQNVKRISINPAWEYQKAQIRDNLNNQTNAEIYTRRKIEVEPVFGRMKAHLGVTRFMVLGLKRVKREMGIAMMAINMVKLSGRMG